MAQNPGKYAPVQETSTPNKGQGDRGTDNYTSVVDST